jgi:A/G-specific adenine glycosylase
MNRLAGFIETVKQYYAEHRRVLEWREHISPYGVLVSEVMLQQTQVPRVAEKFPAFTRRFPSFSALAAATVPEVLSEWQGMGYNRRGLYLRQAAIDIMERYGGVLPKSVEQVDELPGIGHATASAIVTYTYNLPTVFIETNIRRVFIHHFFEDRDEVSDTELLPLVAEAVDKENPRDWYYALMDYGTHLARTVPNPNRRSKHHSVQSKFEGSGRQLRGRILRTLLSRQRATYDDLLSDADGKRDWLDPVLVSMVRDGFIREDDGEYVLIEK